MIIDVWGLCSHPKCIIELLEFERCDQYTRKLRISFPSAVHHLVRVTNFDPAAKSIFIIQWRLIRSIRHPWGKLFVFLLSFCYFRIYETIWSSFIISDSVLLFTLIQSMNRQNGKCAPNSYCECQNGFETDHSSLMAFFNVAFRFSVSRPHFSIGK